MNNTNDKPILTLEHVNKSFGGVKVAQDVSFSVYPGEIKGLIGPNGAGKTTMMNMISGLYEVDDGHIYFDGQEITNMADHKRAKMGIARTFQTPRFMNRSSVRDNLLVGADLGNKIGYLPGFFGKSSTNFYDDVKEMLEIMNFNFEWDEDIDGMPFGKQKLLEIIRSVLSNPKIILIDEPAAGLNNKEIDYLSDIIRYITKKKGIAVLLIEHSMDMVMNLCEDIVVLSFGKVIAHGGPEHVSNDQSVVEAYLGRDDV